MYPPILAIELNFVLADSETVVLIRKIVHLDNHLFSAAVFDHGASEDLVAHVSITDTVVSLFCDISLQVDVPCGILCIRELCHICDHVVCLCGCKSSRWRMSRE